MGNRFKEPKQITDLIDQYKKDMYRLLNEATDDDVLADHLRETKWAWKIEGIRRDAESKRKRASWRESRIKNLGDSLSTLLTPQLPCCDGDSSIPTS
jgi:hypothetical protein